MKIDYDFKPAFVSRVCAISHKAKKDNFYGDLHYHTHGYYEIVFVDYGEILLTLNGKEITVPSRTCIIIPGGEIHHLTGKDQSAFNFMNIMFKGDIPSELVDKKIAVSQNGYELMKKMKQESVDKMNCSNELIACYLTEFIIGLYRQKTLDTPKHFPEIVNLKPHQSEIVHRAVAVIANEYHKPLELKTISNAIGVSIPHLRALLKKETGENFSTLLQKQRIASAKHLLVDANLSIGEISSAVGYSSLAFFFKVFKRLTGMTPKEYASSLGDTQT